MNKLSFEAFKELCQLNSNKNYVKEIYEIISDSDCYFKFWNCYAAGSHSQLIQTAIAIDLGKFDDEYINDFKIAVSNLQVCKSKELGITWLDTKDKSSFSKGQNIDQQVHIDTFKKIANKLTWKLYLEEEDGNENIEI